MRNYQREKLNKILIITTITLLVLSIIMGIIIYINSKNKKSIALYQDTVICNNYFNEIIINFEKKEVKRDEIRTSLQNEFNITEEQENLILSSEQELQNFFTNTVFEIQIEKNIATITNKYQTKKIIVEIENMKGEFSEAKVSNLQDNIYLLEYDTQKRTKAAYEYLNTVEWIKKVELDEVLYIETINDESQTVYGEHQQEIKYNTYGTEEMGLLNFQNIIKENGNPSEVIVSTIGYGACIESDYFKGRINENYYNFIDDSKKISETIPQGSRVLEVIKEGTTDNVKIMPLVVVSDKGYTTVSTIIKAIEYAIQKSDIICYELINKESYMINIALEKAFKENKPFSCVTARLGSEEKQIYPANSATTIAVSSIDKNNRITSYSGTGEYIDFSAYSTDVKEIFNKNSTISRWSGSQYSNAHIVATIALIKTYHKNYTILDIYNVLRNYSVDLGEKQKDKLYGYGVPNFSKLTIKDIDKQAPEIKEIKYDNEKWEKSKQIQIIAEDNIRILEWGISKSQEEKPKEWNKVEGISHVLDIIYEINENSKYYIWVKDGAGNTSFMPIEISKIDNKGPKITYKIDDTTLELSEYVTITVSAEDKQSGLDEMPYSWDGQNWGTESTILKVTENGRYKVYVRDVLGNITEKEIKVDVFPREGIANIDEGTIIKSIVVSSSWNGDINDNVRITFNEGLNVTGWNITTSNEVPLYFENIGLDEYEEYLEENIEHLEENESNSQNFIIQDEGYQEQGYNSSFTATKTLKTGVIYYAWIKDAYNNVKYQTFTISKVEI